MRVSYVVAVLLASTWAFNADADQLDELMPTMLERMSVVRSILVPVPKPVMDEALFDVASYYIPVDSETELCRNHSSMLFDAFLGNEIWALKMVDASSKGGPGTLDGNLMDLGSYGQCLGVTAPNHTFRGQLCVVETRGLLPPEMDRFNPLRAALPVLRTDLMFSVCVPSSCTARDVKTHMDVALNSVNASAILYNSSCSSSLPESLSRADYFTLYLLFLISLFVVLSTWYETITDKTDQNAVLVSFSLTLNTRKLLVPDNSPDSLPCLNGLRVLAISWVLLGHRLLHLLVLPSLRLKDFAENMDSLGWAPMQEVQLAVEVFFLMSGVLAAYNFFKDRNKNKHFSYVSYVVRRYRRLTPPLAFMVLLYATVLVRLTDGPIWKRMFGLTQEYCQRNWWSTLTYVSNYANPYEICIPQTWYLTVDFQLHMLSPLLLWPLYKYQRRGLIPLVVAFVASIVAGMTNAYIMELPATGPFRPDQERAGDVVPSYVETQYRAGSFILGIVLGYLLFLIKHDQVVLKLSKLNTFIGWTISVIFMLSSTYGVVYFVDADYKYNPWVDTLYHILHRYTLSLGVAWVILVCTIGNGGFVNRILSWNALLPLSRLTYGVYLVHYALQDIQAFRTRSGVATDTFTVWYLFFADFLFSNVLAAVLYLAVEAPFNNIINRVFKDDGKKKLGHAASIDVLPAYEKNIILTTKL